MNNSLCVAGVGYPTDLVVCVALGVDMFDCVYAPPLSASVSLLLSLALSCSLSRSLSLSRFLTLFFSLSR